jgi:hypothetical protein
LELFALAYRVKLFNEIVSAVVNNPMRLVTTIVLGVIGLWTFVLLGVAFFQGTYSLGSDDTDWTNFCSDFRSCMAYHIQYGADNPPSFTDDPAPQGQRVLFSFVYTFTLLWIIVATVSGTIIDNLGELRDLRSAIADDLEQRCFICSINRSLFEDVSESGFTDHVHNQHNIWDYLRWGLVCSLCGILRSNISLVVSASCCTSKKRMSLISFLLRSMLLRSCIHGVTLRAAGSISSQFVRLWCFVGPPTLALQWYVCWCWCDVPQLVRLAQSCLR